MDELEPDAWELATSDAEDAREIADDEPGALARRRRPVRRDEELLAPPSASEMAGDGAVGGDGIDEPGWD